MADFDYRALKELGLIPPSLAERVDELRPRWMRRAAYASVGTAAFFPDSRVEQARGQQLCVHCDVVAECRSYALAHDGLAGVWGNMTERDRIAARPEQAA